MKKMKSIISVKNLKKVYKTHTREEGLFNAIKSLFNRKYEYKHALKGISFEIEKGDIVGFIGPNGAGKSTTIKALSGFLYPTSGEVTSLGLTPWKDRVEYVAELGVVLGQKAQLWWDLPAIDTFYLSKDLYDIKESTFKSRLNFMVKLLDLEEVMHTPVRDMSLGERMKCKLVAALLHNPKLVLLDEPSIGLDVIAKDKFRDFIKLVNKKYKTTFIITTHDMQEIERLCKKIIIINNGLIVYDGLLKDIKKEYLSNKFIDVKLETRGEKFKLRYCKTVEQNEYEIKINVNAKKIKVKEVINYLLSNYDVADVLISDPPIESIIQQIFRSKL